MLKKILGYFTLPLLVLAGVSWHNSQAQPPETSTEGQTELAQRMLVVNGNVTMDLDLNRLKGITRRKNRNGRASVSKWALILFSRSLFLTILCAVPSRARWG